MRDISVGIDAAEIEQYLASTCMVVADGKLAIPGHAPLAWPQHWLRYFRDRQDRWSFYEEAATLTFSFLLQAVRPRVVFDIGAGHGYFSRIAASHRDSQPVVHAFDMCPENLDAMSECLRRDGLDGVIVHGTALSDRHEGEREIWYCGSKVFEREPQLSEWQPPLWHRVKFALNGERRTLRKAHVNLTSIDQLVAEHGIIPDLLKIDVDGYEAKVLRGGLRTFEAHHPTIALELHKDKLIRAGDRRSVVGMMLAIGYRALFLTDHHDRRKCRVVPVDAVHPLVGRQETDFLLLV